MVQSGGGVAESSGTSHLVHSQLWGGGMLATSPVGYQLGHSSKSMPGPTVLAIHKKPAGPRTLRPVAAVKACSSTVRTAWRAKKR